MPAKLIQLICAFMIALLITSTGGLGFVAKQIAHELEHANAEADARHAAGVEGAGLGIAGDVAARTSAGDDIEHSLLHASVQVQPGPVIEHAWRPVPEKGIVRSAFVLPVLAHSTREPPFRPPRSAPRA